MRRSFQHLACVDIIVRMLLHIADLCFKVSVKDHACIRHLSTGFGIEGGFVQTQMNEPFIIKIIALDANLRLVLAVAHKLGGGGFMKRDPLHILSRIRELGAGAGPFSLGFHLSIKAR